MDARLAFMDGDVDRLARIARDSTISGWDIKQYVSEMQLRLARQQQKATEVFVSYRHESERHREWSKRLAGDLRVNGINALLDEWEIGLGDSISDYAAAGISKADAMLFVVTESALAAVEGDATTRSVLKFEFQIANARRYRDGNFKIIGILRSGNRPPNHISDTLYLDFRQDEQYETQLARLVNGLTGISNKPNVRPRLWFPPEQAYRWLGDDRGPGERRLP